MISRRKITIKRDILRLYTVFVINIYLKIGIDDILTFVSGKNPDWLL